MKTVFHWKPIVFGFFGNVLFFTVLSCLGTPWWLMFVVGFLFGSIYPNIFPCWHFEFD